MNYDIVRTIFLKGIQDEYIDVLNLMVTGDASQLTFEEIPTYVKNTREARLEVGKE